MNIYLARELSALADIARLCRISWQAACRGILPEPYLDSLEDILWMQSFQLPGRTCLVLEKDGIPASAACVSPARDPQMEGWGELDSIYLLPQFFHRGLGTPLLQAALKQLKEAGYERVYADVLAENQPALCFYEKNGFQPASFFERTIGGSVQKMVRCTRKL